jgi:hypothetical protein
MEVRTLNLPRQNPRCNEKTLQSRLALIFPPITDQFSGFIVPWEPLIKWG